MPDRGSHEPAAALITLLKTINGGPTYWSDVGDRVYNRLVPPEDTRITKFPYFCVPTLDDKPVYLEPDGGTHLVHQWDQPVFGFVRDTAGTKSLNSNAQEQLLKLHDDFMKLWFTDHTWNGTVEDSLPVAGPRHAGILSKYGEFVISLQMKSFLSFQGLGP